MSSVELKKWFFPDLACVNSFQVNVVRLWWLWLEQCQGKDLQKHNNKGKPDPVKHRLKM
jgi:hypothetical protein